MGCKVIKLRIFTSHIHNFQKLKQGVDNFTKTQTGHALIRFFNWKVCLSTFSVGAMICYSEREVNTIMSIDGVCLNRRLFEIIFRINAVIFLGYNNMYKIKIY